MKALEDGPPAVAAGFGVRQTGACRTRHGLRGRRYAVSSLELVGRGGLGRRLLDGLRELEVVESMDQSRAGQGFRIIASKRGSKDDVYRAMFLEDDD